MYAAFAGFVVLLRNNLICIATDSSVSCRIAINSRHRPITGTGETVHVNMIVSVCDLLLRKEVIQPQVPLRLPCYDFIPVTSYTLGPCLLAVGAGTSGATDFHDVTGGVYKTRERIHGTVADVPLLAIPASWRRVAASNPN